MKLTSVKLSKAEAKEMTSCAPAPADQPRYPYGLSLSLDGDTLDKLGLETMPEVGSVLMLTARVEVTGCNTNETQGSEPNRSCSLQITDMGLEGSKTSVSADKLYAKGKE